MTISLVADGAKLYVESHMGLVNTMETAHDLRTDFNALTLPLSWVEQNWYALYTCANHEKRVATELRARTVEHFLPLYSSARRWKDRRVTLELPLFPGYLFVRLALRDRLRVQQVPGVVHLVGFNGTPTAVSEEELLRIREITTHGMRAEPHPFLTVGQRVRVKEGPLTGLHGILVRRKSKLRLVISMELIMRSLAIEMDEADLEEV